MAWQNLSLRKSKVRETNTSIIKTNWSDHSDEITRIRDLVFIQEQNVSKAIEMDGKDAECIHFLISRKNDYIGTARLKLSGKIERVSILGSYRRKGLGSQLMKFIIKTSKKLKLNNLYLHSQMESIEFYEQLGFIKKGDVFIEAGINHIFMELYDE